MRCAGDGKVQLDEFETQMHPATRKKIEGLLNAGWMFDPELWTASVERHSKWDMSKVFKQFDTDGDGVLDMDEFKRAFHALGLKNREGKKYDVDQEMFNRCPRGLSHGLSQSRPLTRLSFERE